MARTCHPERETPTVGEAKGDVNRFNIHFDCESVL